MMNAKSDPSCRLARRTVSFGRTARLTTTSALCLFLLASCAPPAGEKSETEDNRIFRVVTTATMVGDMVKGIGGDRVSVDNLMGPGVDPHLYRPSIIDIRRVSRSDGIFYVGLRFEELMQGVLEQRKKAGQKIFALSDAIPREDLLAADDGTAGDYDPHIWFDVDLWAQCVDAVVDGLVELDPESRTYYEKRGEEYRRELLELHDWALGKAAEIPEEQRVLVTSHDAYNYFGRAYGFEVVGLMNISTAGKSGRADIAQLVDFVRENEVPAIFVDSSISPRPIERVGRDSGANIGGELFSDAIGPEGVERLGFDVETFDGTVRYNLTTLVEALR